MLKKLETEYEELKGRNIGIVSRISNYVFDTMLPTTM